MVPWLQLLAASYNLRNFITNYSNELSNESDAKIQEHLSSGSINSFGTEMELFYDCLDNRSWTKILNLAKKDKIVKYNVVSFYFFRFSNLF